ncbi:integrase core domain-containing protein [Streptomyces sp. NPDC058877]|uniref:integrase core domain-containing protein n=1 Tax=Streptomyces sp. NPDC058877 TaxID=3346665 RepID=UPI003696A575
MESTGKKPRPRCSFRPECKAEIVELCRRGDRKVSRAAFCAHRTGIPSPCAVRDAELTDRISALHERSRGTCGARASTPSSSARASAAVAADHLRTELVANALRAAHRTRRQAGPVLHPLLGPGQCAGCEFTFLTREFSMRPSVGRTGRCWDNALTESFFATLKNELLEARPWPGRSAARTALFEWIESRYDVQRLHSSLGYRTAADYEATPAA